VTHFSAFDLSAKSRFFFCIEDATQEWHEEQTVPSTCGIEQARNRGWDVVRFGIGKKIGA
jgi:hypothetical protein